MKHEVLNHEVFRHDYTGPPSTQPVPRASKNRRIFRYEARSKGDKTLPECNSCSMTAPLIFPSESAPGTRLSAVTFTDSEV